MKVTLYVVFIVSVFLSACTSKVDEVTAPAPMSPAAEAAGWSRARTWTPTRTTTPTRTPTSTPTPAVDLSGWWFGTLTDGPCVDVDIHMFIGQSGDTLDAFFPTSCFQGAQLELFGTLEGNALRASLWYGDILLGDLAGPASPMSISVWNPGHTIGLTLSR